MGVILTVAGLVFGGFLYQPMWFDSGPYTQIDKKEFTSMAECQIDTAGTKDICVGSNPVKRYVLDKDAYQSSSAPLDYVKCDYWAGCYAMKEEK